MKHPLFGGGQQESSGFNVQDFVEAEGSSVFLVGGPKKGGFPEESRGDETAGTEGSNVGGEIIALLLGPEEGGLSEENMGVGTAGTEAETTGF